MDNINAVFSHYQASILLDNIAKKTKGTSISLDLGKTLRYVTFDYNKKQIERKGELIISFDALGEISKDYESCFEIKQGIPEKIKLFSVDTHKAYKLFPTGIKSPPTIEISGIRMHQVKDMDPKEDTRIKIECVSPIKGMVLDTCCGLGYTAIASSWKAREVWTYEIDKNVQDVARRNPWSKELFTSKRIKIKNGNIYIGIKEIDFEFDRIIHDPPTFKLASSLYSGEFYKDVFRVLKHGGILYHYTGDPGKARRVDVAGGVMNRLKKVGFQDVHRKHKGVVCMKY